MDISFQSPIFLWFLALIPLLVAMHHYSLNFARSKAVRFANIEALERLMQSKNIVPDNYLLLALRALALVGFTLAASGITLNYTSMAPAYDFVLAVDTSNSMLARDVPPTRMGAALSSLQSWVGNLPSGTRVGLVTFSSQATVLLPPSGDMTKLGMELGSISPGSSGGTALCEALRASVNQLMDSKNPCAVVLVSDGQNNAGCRLDDGIGYANENNITVFSIGVGSREGGTIEDMPGLVFGFDGTDLDRTAQETGGNYSGISSPAELDAALASLSHPVEMPQNMPLATYSMILSFALVFLDWGLSSTKYHSGP